jgi:hypothetical protein
VGILIPKPNRFCGSSQSPSLAIALAGRNLPVVTAFTAAVDTLFTDPNIAMDAIYRAGGADPGMPVRAIVRQPDRIGTFGETRIATETTIIDIRTSDINAPAEGDIIEMDGAVYIIQGEPIRDAERLVWTIEARAQ